MSSLMLSLLLQAAPTPVCDEEKRDQGIQQEMNLCAAIEYREADAKLNAQWPITSAKMKERDEQWNDGHNLYGDTRAGYFETLLESQRAWLKYRDAHCRAEGYSARGGSLEPLLVSTCKTALTEARTKELRDLVSPWE